MLQGGVWTYKFLFCIERTSFQTWFTMIAKGGLPVHLSSSLTAGQLEEEDGTSAMFEQALFTADGDEGHKQTRLSHSASSTWPGC
jgi:hypothetical protein